MLYGKTPESYFRLVKHTVAQTWQQNRNIVFLILRIFFGLRLLAGGLRRLFDSDRLHQFHQRLQELQVDGPFIAVVMMAIIQLLAGILLIIGYRMKLAAIGLAAICIFLVATVPADHLFEQVMPPVATMLLSLGFFFIPPGRISLDHYIKHRRGRSDIKDPL